MATVGSTHMALLIVVLQLAFPLFDFPARAAYSPVWLLRVTFEMTSLGLNNVRDQLNTYAGDPLTFVMV